MSTTKTSEGAPSSFWLPQTDICFLPDRLPQSGQAPVWTAFPAAQRAQLQTFPCLLLLQKAGRGGKSSLPPRFTVPDFQMLMDSNPRKCLRSHRKPKPHSAPFLCRQSTISPPPQPASVSSSVPWLCLEYLRLLSNTLSNKTPARGH